MAGQRLHPRKTLESPQVRESWSLRIPSLFSQGETPVPRIRMRVGEAIPLSSYCAQWDECQESWSEGILGLGPNGGFPGALLGRKHIRLSRESANIETQGQCQQKDCKDLGWLAATVLELGRFGQCFMFTSWAYLLKWKKFFKYVVLASLKHSHCVDEVLQRM